MGVDNVVDIVQIGPVTEYPVNVGFRSVEYLSDIFHRQKLWKAVDKNEIMQNIKIYEKESIFWNLKNYIEAYKEDTMLVGENPLAPQRYLHVACTVDAYTAILAALRTQRDTYEARVSNTKTCVPREWLSYGSEKEVDEARVEATREKISVEWIGNLEKRYESVNFVDVEPEDVPNGYVGFAGPNGRRQYSKIVRKTRLDIGIQVSVRFCNTHAQTDTYEIAREFDESDGSHGTSDQTSRIQTIESEETPPSSADIQHTRHIDDVSLNYHKSFINMDKRTKAISSVAWHPVKPGYVAIAYVCRTAQNDLEDRVIAGEIGHRVNKPFAQKIRKTVNENDIETNDFIFDLRSHKKSTDRAADEDSASESESTKDESEDEESEHESFDEARFDVANLLVYDDTSTHPPTLASHSSPPKDDPRTSEFSEADLKWAFDLLTNDVVDPKNATPCKDDKPTTEDDRSSDTAESVDSIDSESSLSSTIKSEAPLRAPLYDDTRSEDTDSIEDDIPITDTDSSVLLWSCENDLTPQLNLYNVHDVNVIKFYPVHGNLLAGGSNSGQLVVWDIHEDMEKFKLQRRRCDSQKYISKFMDNLPGWEAEDSKCPLVHPVAISIRNISHLDKITNLEWMHPSLKLSTSGSGAFTKTESDPSKQILTSSLDGGIKVWQLHYTHTSGESGPDTSHLWDLQLIYNLLVTIPKLEKYSSSIESFKISVPPVQYVSTSTANYEFVPETAKKINSSILIANTIGEVGVIKFPDKKDAFIDGATSKSAENCKHEWWAICHDDSISSLSQNYFFPHIALSTGGRIFALWKVDFKNGPIWWKQYPVDVSLTDGCFTPFHPGIIYIARSDGIVDLWNITKQVHEPVLHIKASGYRIDALSVVTPPCKDYQLSVADSNGIFHVLNNRYNVAWNEDDLKAVEIFFKRAEECKKQLLHWNKHWKELSTTTDEYGFHYKPEQIKKSTDYTTRKDPKPRPSEHGFSPEKLIEPAEPRLPFLQQIATSEESQKLLQKLLDDLQTLPDAIDHQSAQPDVDEPISANAIRNLYCT